ncbi:MAG TPA: phosphotransferase [Polyangiaceae bacterium]|nr:phosphotransferase [Polyangiaceae bacterium]
MPQPPHAQHAQLAEQIRKGVSAERVELGERVQSLWGGYGELRRAVLFGGETQSAIVKSVAPPPEREFARSAAKLRSHRRKLRSYEVELAFYRGFAGTCDAACRVPDLLYGDARDGRFLFVLEDLDAAGFAERRTHCSEREISACLALLASFHARFLGVAPDGLWKVGTYWHLATRPDELAALGASPLRQAASRIDARLNGARFKTLVHGDAKLENFCFSSDSNSSVSSGSEVAAVDFQYVGGGVGVKDVAYFLSSCLSPRECESQVPHYLDVYFSALRAALAAEASRRSEPQLDAAQLEREWRELFPLAWVDFHRFLLGWAPSYADGDRYSAQVTQKVLAHFTG